LNLAKTRKSLLPVKSRFFVLAIILSILGVFVQLLFGVTNALNQLSFVILSFSAAILISRLDIRIFLKTTHFLSVFGCLMLFLLLFLVDPIRGAQRWFVFLGFNFQPSVIFIPFFLLSLATMLNELKEHNFRSLIKILSFILLPVLLIFKQPDLGTALVVGFSLFSMSYLTHFPIRYYLTLLLGLVPFLALGVKLLKPYQIARLISFINPNYDPSGINYNSLQSVIAIGSGFLIGKGFNSSSQSHLYFLPESHTDFVFAAASEAFGFLGSTIIVILLFSFLFTLLNAIKDSPNQLFRYYIFGVTSYFFIQIFFNVGMNLRLLPVVGVPLPFISYGGSSLLSSYILIAIAFKLKELS